jgi:hypothetical protein
MMPSTTSLNQAPEVRQPGPRSPSRSSRSSLAQVSYSFRWLSSGVLAEFWRFGSGWARHCSLASSPGAGFRAVWAELDSALSGISAWLWSSVWRRESAALLWHYLAVFGAFRLSGRWVHGGCRVSAAVLLLGLIARRPARVRSGAFRAHRPSRGLGLMGAGPIGDVLAEVGHVGGCCACVGQWLLVLVLRVGHRGISRRWGEFGSRGFGIVGDFGQSRGIRRVRRVGLPLIRSSAHRLDRPARLERPLGSPLSAFWCQRYSALVGGSEQSCPGRRVSGQLLGSGARIRAKFSAILVPAFSHRRLVCESAVVHPVPGSRCCFARPA